MKENVKNASQKFNVVKRFLNLEFKTLKPRKIHERGGSWINLTNLITSELFFFTVFWFLCSSTKILNFCSASCVLSLKYSFTAMFSTSKLMPREKFGSDMAETRLEAGNVAAYIISAGIRSQRSIGRLGVITSNIQQLFCILIGCISYGMVQSFVK